MVKYVTLQPVHQKPSDCQPKRRGASELAPIAAWGEIKQTLTGGEFYEIPQNVRCHHNKTAERTKGTYDKLRYTYQCSCNTLSKLV